MNEEKVISLSNRLNEIVDEANRHHSGITSHITWNKAVYAIEALSEEANSKIIMPNWTDSERSQLQTLKREETFNQAMKDLLDRGGAMGQKFNSVDQDTQIEIVKDIVDYFQNKADFAG